jgi:hypothetical protein
MPEDQVAKRGTTVQLECRVKHDPSLKLTVSWLKDDEPLYIGNRFLLSISASPYVHLRGSLPLLSVSRMSLGSY